MTQDGRILDFQLLKMALSFVTRFLT